MIKIDDIVLGYGERVLLDHVSADISGGQIVALLGRNGTGKSTLLRAIAGMGSLKSGHILFDGRDSSELRRDEFSRIVSFVTTERIRIPNLYCKDVVALGRAPYTNWVGRLSDRDYEVVNRSMRLVGMESYARKTMDCMSDGECQRVMIARALAQDTPVILLDEPTSFLDLPNRYDLVSLLRDMAHNEGKCVIFSTHELDIALSLCDSVALIDNPNLYYMPTSEMVSSGHIERVFKAHGFDFNTFIRSFNLK